MQKVFFVKFIIMHRNRFKAFRLRIEVTVFIFLLFGQVCSAQSSFSGLPFVRNFKTEDYKAGLQNFAITQDRRGIIYVANNYGLVEYDGDKWKTYGVGNGTKVRSTAIDERGRIYVGSQGDFGYFFPDKIGQLVYTSLADSLKAEERNFDETWSVYVDHEKVYFCTFSNLYVFNGKTIEVIKPENPIDLSFLVNRQLIVNQRTVGLCVLEKGRLKSIHGAEYFKTLDVSGVLLLQGDDLLISTSQDGIFKLSNGVVMPWNSRTQDLFIEANVNCLIRLRNGRFAIGTQNKGLIILDINGNVLVELTRDRGLPNRTVLSLYEDDLQHLWVGQNSALSYVELGSPFTFLKEASGIAGTGYSAYLDGSKLYLGTNTGLFRKDITDSGYFKLIKNSIGQIYSIGRYQGELLISHQRGAMHMDNNQTTLISSIPGSWAFLLFNDNREKILEGTYTGLQLYSLTNGRWTHVSKLNQFSESSRVMAEGADGAIWVTHGNKGAFQIQLNTQKDSILRVNFYGSNKGFPTNRLINVFKVRGELVFTGENGIYKYDKGTDRFVVDAFFSAKIGAGSQIWFIREDAIGNIYFIGREHLGVLRKNSVGEYVLYESEFNKIRKYLNDDLQNITVLANNEVLFAAKEGFIHFDPTLPTSNRPLFSTRIRDVRTSKNNETVLFAGTYLKNDSSSDRQQPAYKPNLPYEDNSLVFSFASSFYEGDGDNKYQYYLENFEKGWSEWSQKTQKEYTNLKEGKYNFHVRAKNINGDVTDDATFEFKIFPPWYRSQWAYAAYSFSIIGFLVLGFNLLDRKYKRAKQTMLEKQNQELSEKDAKLARLKVHSQEEINRLQNEKLEAELNHMKNELATATMHLLNKNEFIISVKTEINKLAKKETQEEIKTQLSGISKDIENNVSDDSDWEHFQFHFDRVHGDFNSRLKKVFPMLSPQETKLCAYLRMNLSTKEIAQLLNISVRGVEISRYRLRKKMRLDHEKNLLEFVLNF